MMRPQIVYRQISHSPQSILNLELGIMQKSTIFPVQQIRVATPIRQQRSCSHFEDKSQSSIKKQQENIEKENDQLREIVKQLKQQIQIIEFENENREETEEQYLVALRIFQELKIEAEQLKLEFSYIKQENNLLRSKLKQINY